MGKLKEIENPTHRFDGGPYRRIGLRDEPHGWWTKHTHDEQREHTRAIT